MTTKNSLLPFLGATLIFIIYIFLFWSYSIDDAFITFRYAENLADGHGLTMNPGDAPVEAYSNFLWLLLLSLLYKIGLPIYWAAKVIGVVCAYSASLVWFNYSLKNQNQDRKYIAVLFLVIPFITFWSVSGLEFGLYCLLLSLFITSFWNRYRLSSFHAGLLVLIRPEAILIILAALTLDYFISRESRPPKISNTINILSVTLIVFLTLTIFRWYYFGYPLPNTIYAKSVLTSHGFLQLTKGMILLLPLTILFCVALIKNITNPDRSPKVILSGSIFIIIALISCLADAVMNFHFRYMTPFLPFFILVALNGFSSIKGQTRKIVLSIAIILFSISPIYGILNKIDYEKIIIGSQDKVIDFINRQPVNLEVSITDVGRIPYYTEANFNDLWGLASKDISQNGFKAAKELTRFPDYFIFVGDTIGEAVDFRFGREVLIHQLQFFKPIYKIVYSTQEEPIKILDKSSYNYIIFEKNQKIVDSLIEIYPFN